MQSVRNRRNIEVPLVVAVTGHRDLAATEIPRIRAAVREFFDELRSAFPGMPLRVMTPIADGADRLVAEVAAEEGIDLLFVLPMPATIYRDDFDELSEREFDRLLDLGAVIELPLLSGVTPSLIRTSQSARERQYERLGVYLAAHCHILLALWDGERSAGPGGTASVVRFHQQALVEVLSDQEKRSPIDFSEDESDLVYHIPCSRADSAPLPVVEQGRGRWLTRDGMEPAAARMPERYRGVFERMVEFNADLGAVEEHLLAPALVPESCDDLSPHASDIELLFRCVDGLAVAFQRKARMALRGTYLLAACAGLSFVAYADLTAQHGILLAYLLFTALGGGLYLLERLRSWHRRAVDYRVLAEGLRVQFFWALAGVRPVSEARFSHDCFMKRQDLELGWIRNVMRHAGVMADAAPVPESRRGCEMAVRDWVGDVDSGQLGYYRARAAERRWRSRLTERLSLLSFVTGLLCALTLVLAWGRIEAPWSNVLIALMGSLPFLAAVRQSYAQRMAEHELVNQYEHTARLYGNARQLLQNARSIEETRDVLRALGEAALDENALWLLRQRERPLSGRQMLQGT